MTPRLPIEKLSEEEFDSFKNKYLDDDILSEKAIKEIRKLFMDGNPNTGNIACDEMHGHGYRCVYFYNPMTGVVNRLLCEIERYQAQIKSVKDLTRELE